MRKVKIVVLAAAVVLLFWAFSAADSTKTQTLSLNVQDICVLHVTGNPSSLTVGAPTTGGDNPTSPYDESTYARYTSVVGSGLTRALTAEWGGSDAAPAGCSLKLVVSEITSAHGTAGTATSEITVSSSAANIVTGISSCATGSGSGGAKLKYTLSVDNPANLVAGDSESVTITLTLTDAS